MQYYKKRDFGKSGIYAIRNTLNNKVYVGKAKCIDSRIRQHVTYLNKKNKDENRHLINSWHKYGKNAFEYIVLEYLPFDSEILKVRELFWQRNLKATDREKGYNLREESETGLVCLQETKEKLKQAQIKRFQNPEERKKCSHNYWKNNPNAVKSMSINVSKAVTKYYICQYDKETNELIKEWDSIAEILLNFPNYKKHNIYAVCSGEKPSMYGYKWKKFLKS